MYYKLIYLIINFINNILIIYIIFYFYIYIIIIKLFLFNNYLYKNI